MYLFFGLCHLISTRCRNLHLLVDWKQSSTMKFDSILTEIDGFGKFQIRLILIQILSRISLPCHFLLNNFMAAVPSHHCNITALDDGGIFGNLTREQKLSVGVPSEQDGTLSSCQMFSEPQYQHLFGPNSTEDAVTVPCADGWVYDNSTFKSTLATEVSVFNKQCNILSCYLCFDQCYVAQISCNQMFFSILFGWISIIKCKK